MTVALIAKNGDEMDLANGEWAAITAMAWAFGILDKPWSGNHDEDVTYTPDQLRAMSDRMAQLGRRAEGIKEMADGGTATIS